MPQRKRYNGRKRYSSPDMNFHMPRVAKSLEFCAPLRKNANVIFPSAGITATPVNTPTFSWEGMELSGSNQYVNYGDLTFLNAVSAFTIMFWINQDVLDVISYIFQKRADDSNRIEIRTLVAGDIIFVLNNGGTKYAFFDLSTLVAAGSWHHMAMVFDGARTGNSNRLIVYVDGSPVTLAFAGAMPATTVDLAGEDAIIGRSSRSFDGQLKDWRIFSRALSVGEIKACMHPTT